MKTLDLADVSRLPEELKDGETIELRDGGRRVATVYPTPEQKLEARIDELVAQGLATRGSGEPFPEDFFTRPLPSAERSVLDALYEDRDSER